MKRHTLLLANLLLLFFPLTAQFGQLSPAAELHILTADPGAPLYSAFGHCAFRIVDENARFDRIYNYGSFDFNTPGFYQKFIQGKLPYFLAAESAPSFVRTYAGEGRAVQTQVLDLSPEDVQKVYVFLENNRLPENKFYPYDFFFDNCATRERDVLTDVLGENLDWNPWPEDSLGSLRDLLDIYLAERPWEDFGIDLVLGLPADRVADQQLSMFLPDYLYHSVARARIKKGGAWRPLVRNTETWVKPQQRFESESPTLTPKLVFWGLFVLTLAFSILVPARKPAARAFDFVFFLIVGLLGVLMLLFWTATNHQATYSNLNLLWAFPTYLVFAIQRLRRRNKGQRLHAQWALVATLIGALAYFFFPQPYNAATIPLILTLVVRLISVVAGTLDD